jgi:hypothetical protein
LSTEDDVTIAVRSLAAVAPFLVKDGISNEVQSSWAHAFIFFIVAQGIASKAKSAAKQALTQTYLRVSPADISRIIVQGIWSWYRSSEQEDKDSAAVASKTGSNELAAVLGCLCLPREAVQKHGATIEEASLRAQALSMIVLARSEMIPRISWIDLCLRMGVDPGELVRAYLKECIDTINEVTEVLPTDDVLYYRPLTIDRIMIMTNAPLLARQRTVLTPIWHS